MAIEAIRRWIDFRKETTRLSEDALPAEVVLQVNKIHMQYKNFLTTSPPTDGSSRIEEMTALGKEVGDRIDQLSDPEKKAYIRAFCDETSFPNTRDTSRKIVTHFTDSVNSAAESMNITIGYAGYAYTCSVGKGLALPGSDMDCATLIIREEDFNVLEYFQRLITLFNPRLVDIRMGIGIYTPNQVKEFVHYLKTHDNKVNYPDICKLGWSKGQIWYASQLVTNIRTKSNLIDNLGSDNKQFQDVKDEEEETARLNDGYYKFRKDKYSARKSLLTSFNNLTLDEQFAIIRILQISSECTAFNFSSKGPNAKAIQSLTEKGLLVYEKGHLKASWAPYPWLFRNKWLWFYPENDS